MKKYNPILPNVVQTALLIIFSVLLLTACKKDKAEDFKMDAQGPVGQIMVVCKKEYLRGALGDTIRSLLGRPYDGLVMPEPSFSIDSLPPNLFSGYVKRHRNVLEIRIDPKARNIFAKKDDVFAYNQNYMLLEAKSDTAAIRLLSEYKDTTMDYFEEGEVRRYAKLHNSSYSSISDTIASVLGFSVSCPEFGLKRKGNDFVWISKETKRTSLAVLLYSIPYVSQEQFSVDSLIKIKNQFLKKYVEGPNAGTYQAVESKVPVVSKVTQVNGLYTVNVRGAWTLVGDFMGGPFVMDAVLDEQNQRIIFLDSYIFAPEARFNRINFLREAEGVFYTLKINKNKK